MEDIVHFAFFEDFNEPSVLFSGSSAALTSFANILHEIAMLKNEKLTLNDSPIFRSWRQTEVTLSLAESNFGMKKILSSKAHAFEWRLSVLHLKDFANKIREVAVCKNPCHQYLDCNSGDDVQVIVSTREYNRDFFAAVDKKENLNHKQGTEKQHHRRDRDLLKDW